VIQGGPKLVGDLVRAQRQLDGRAAEALVTRADDDLASSRQRLDDRQERVRHGVRHEHIMEFGDKRLCARHFCAAASQRIDRLPYVRHRHISGHTRREAGGPSKNMIRVNC
jgi:hypothetical protein